MNNNFFKEMGALPQLLLLCSCSFCGLIIGAFISAFLGIVMGEPVQSPEAQSLLFIRLSQFITTIFWLLIPAYLYIVLFHGKWASFLTLNKKQSISWIALTILLIVAIQPLVGFAAFLNEQVVFPEAMSGVESTFKEWREASEELIEKLLVDNSLSGIISNVFIIAVLAAFVEEVFFRGCLQQIVQRIVNNKHIAIWITAIIFSAVHLDFFGFLPRVLLGAMLGYLFVWSRNLWIPIIVHFVNNLLSIIVQQIYYGTEKFGKPESFNMQDDLIYLTLSLIFTTLIVAVLVKKSKGEVERLS